MENGEIVQRNTELFAALKKYPADTKEYREILSEIIKNNEPLVINVAQKYFPVMQKFKLDRDDLLAEGRLGMLRAIQSFDPSKGAFSTYAKQYIKGRILNRFRDEKKHCQTCSLQDSKKNYTGEDGGQQKLEDTVAAPFNLEEDLLEKDERAWQLAWVRENLDQVTPFQRKVLTAKFLSGETAVTNRALAQEFACWPNNIADAVYRGTVTLKGLAHEVFTEKTAMTQADKIKLKDGVLKNLILTKLNPQEQKAMLCRFYSGTKKNNRQVAQEVGTTKATIDQRVHRASKKLYHLCDRVQDKSQLKKILESTAELGGSSRV